MMEGIDKAAYAAQKRQEKEKYNKDLTAAIGTIAKDKNWLQVYLEVQGRLPSYSVGNAIMIAIQYPVARHVRLATEWADIGVKPLRGVKGITILVPGKQYQRQDGSIAQGYDVRRAFDISQTSAGSFDQRPPRRQNTDLLRGLLDYQKGGWQYATTDDGQSARYDPDTNTIYVRRHQPFSTLFPVLAKEIICADLVMSKKIAPSTIPDIATCVAWMLCSHYELTTDGLQLPEPASVMGADPNQYRQQLTQLTSELRSIINFTEKVIAKSQKLQEAAL